MRPRWVVAVVLVLGALAFGWSRRQGAAAASAEAEGPKKAETAAVEQRDMARYVEAVGVVEPAFVLEVKSKASGEITSMPFEEGDRVQAGDLLVELLPVDEERNLRKQRATVLAAEAQLAKARNAIRLAELDLVTKREQAATRVERAKVTFEVARDQLKRLQDLLARELVSRREVDDARRASEQAEADLEVARSEQRALEREALVIEDRRQDAHIQEATVERERVNLEVAEIRLAETRIHAPMPGLVLERPVERGQIIASGISNVSGGTTLMSLADVGSLFLEADVDESDIGGIKPGLPVELTAEAFPDAEFDGEVVRVAPRGVEESSITVFKVRIQLGKRSIRRLKPGMNCTARIIIARADGALVVPTRAIQRQKKQFGVTVVPGEDAAGLPRFVPVELGIRDDRGVAVTGELKPGDLVVLQEGEGGGRGGGGRSMRAGMRTARRVGGS